VLEMLTRNVSLSLILESLVRGIEEDDDDLRCAIVLVAGSPKHLRTAVAPSLPEFFIQAIDGLEIGHGERSCGHAAFTGERMVVEDIQSHPFWAAMRDVAAQAGVHSCWAEPIRLSTGEVIGTFAIYRTRPKAPQAHEIEFIESAARLAGIAIERQHKDAELKIAAQVFETSQEGIMVTDAANRIIAVNQAFTRITGYSREEAVGAAPSLLSSGQHDETFFQAMWDAVVGAGNWQGEIWNRRKNGELYVEWLSIQCVRDPEGGGLRRIGLFTDITDRKQANELAWRNANFDLLTQLPNRRLFFDRLEQDIKQAQRDNARLALLFIDLDHFKQVNDMQGHAMGDALLQETAQRLGASMAQTDTLARLGSDQFAIILGEFLHPQDIECTASRLLDALRQPFELGAHPTHITASIGIAVYPDDGPSAHSLLRNADHAMHVAKSQGRNSFSYFTAAMQQAAQQRRHLLADLHGALAKEQFELAYQPIVDLATGRIDKAEALLRWRHPQHGLVNPAAFIPLAEESGLIQSIGDWVFREAMHTTQGLIERTGVPLKTSVNVSPVQFANDEFPAQWLAHLQKNGITASALAVEITEGILIHHRPEVVRKLAALRQTGITVAIDDFGTGYSSLSYIKRFDIDVLKIDQSFVRDMADDFSSQALVEAIIVMAHKLGLKVVAEGIETAEQRDLLVALGCGYGQGYFLSRPVSAQDFEQLLLAQSCALAE
jgi:diguanylate cyclase (GGDEF)-like protein/PAS domain S-box-containing protein